MRLLKYMTEQYLDGVKVGSHIMDIYKNPSPTEMRDLRNNVKLGFRFIIDTKNKNFYISDANFTHSDMFERSKELKKDVEGFSFGSGYYNQGKGIDRILTGATEKKNFDELLSDTLMYDIASAGNEDNWPHILAQLHKLLDKDYSFMNKWIKEDKIKALIQQCMDHLEAVMAGEEDPE